MNRLILWTLCVVLAASVAVFDLVTEWALHVGWLDLTLFIGLFGIAVGLFVALLRTGIGERRRIRASAETSLEMVRRAARGARWSALAAAGLTVLLFANCTGSISNSPTALAGPMSDASNFLKLAAVVVLPLVLVLAVTAALATAAELFAGRQRERPALRAAQAGVWSAVIFILVAFATLPVGFFVGVSDCDVGTSLGLCAAGVGTFTNLFAAAAAALLIPYATLIASALARKPGPAPTNDPAVRWDGARWLSADGLLTWNGSQWLEAGTPESEQQGHP